MTLRRLAAGVLAACPLALLPAGCGEDPPVTIDGRTLRLRLDEYRIMPQDVRVQPGRLRIVATNVGRLTHNVKIVRVDSTDLEKPAEEVAGTRSTQPGESTSVTIEDLQAGEYRLACTIANHDDLGQYGTLAVRGGKE